MLAPTVTGYLPSKAVGAAIGRPPSIAPVPSTTLREWMYSMETLTKQRVFEIMGKLYGNAHYRSAIVHGDSENDLYVLKDILDAVNALGYSFCTMQRLCEHEDIRFVPIILQNYARFDSIRFQQGVIWAIHFRSYADYVPELLRIYHETPSPSLRTTLTNCLLEIKSPKYKQDYLEIVSAPGYGYNIPRCEHDYILDLLCELRLREALPILLNLVEDCPHSWTWTFLQYAARFRDPSVIEHLSPFLQSNDGEFRAMARKAIKKLEALTPEKG